MTNVTELLKSIPENSIWIDNAWVEASGCDTYRIVNPATDDTLFHCARTNSNYVDQAVQSSRTAFQNKEWRYLSPAKRGKLLSDLAKKIREKADLFAYLESLNNGKTVFEAQVADLPQAANIFEYYAGWTNKYKSEVLPVEGAFLNYTVRQPLGVIGAIIPWNFPLLMACYKLAPALAVGNTVVLKPSEQTPLTAMLLMECMKEVGFPNGVVNLVTGFGDTGELLTRHRQIDKISFTGSRAVATSILHAVADTNLKRVSFELGGKSPQIVFPDANLDEVAESVFWGIFFNKGEICTAGSRLIVHQEIHDSLVERLLSMARSLKVGSPQAPDARFGSLISKKQMEKVLKYIEIGREEGAELVFGGNRLLEDGMDKGFFVEPAIFDRVTKEMRVAQEEIFGPVLTILTFETEEEAIEIANSTIYGLVSSIWTQNISRAIYLSEQINAGTIWINHYDNYDSGSPFGGFKESGWGREKGDYALDEFTEIKSIWLPIDRK